MSINNTGSEEWIGPTILGVLLGFTSFVLWQSPPKWNEIIRSEPGLTEGTGTVLGFESESFKKEASHPLSGLEVVVGCGEEIYQGSHGYYIETGEDGLSVFGNSYGSGLPRDLSSVILGNAPCNQFDEYIGDGLLGRTEGGKHDGYLEEAQHPISLRNV